MSLRAGVPWAGLVAGLWLAGLTGCAERRPIEPQAGVVHSTNAATADGRAALVARDPRAYLYQVRANTRKLDEYTLVLTRTERRGLFNALQGPERIQCWFRREPFSVRMKWLDDDVKYGESTYVAGEQGDRVRFVPRAGFLGLKPQVVRVGVDVPTVWGEARYPVTAFGLERLMDRTIDALEAAGDEVTVTYEGLANLPGSGRTVHHLRLHYLPKPGRAPVQDLYIDVARDLPAMTIIKLDDGRVDTSYLYDELDTDVALTDSDFLLELERAALASGAGTADDAGARTAADSSAR